jgi:hypothetical protein
MKVGALILVIILLFPGACSLYFAFVYAMMVVEYGLRAALDFILWSSPLWLGGVALAGLGVRLIRREWRRGE